MFRYIKFFSYKITIIVKPCHPSCSPFHERLGPVYWKIPKYVCQERSVAAMCLLLIDKMTKIVLKYSLASQNMFGGPTSVTSDMMWLVMVDPS